MKSKKGGAREGAGRPTGTTKTENKQSLTVRLPPDLLEALTALGNKSKIVETALREYLGKHAAPPL